jgi:LysM repeat protein
MRPRIVARAGLPPSAGVALRPGGYHRREPEGAMANLDQLKAKYQSVIDLGKERGVSWKNVHVENEKLLIRGAAPNESIKNEVWSAIKAIDAQYADLTADITIDSSLPVPSAPKAAPPPAAKEPRTYEVVAGDTLSKIAKQFYGDAAKYPKIFEANRDQLKDPNVIKPGQRLKIPE